MQIDHITVTKNGVLCKHFQAWDRCSKFIHAQIDSHAKSSSAKRFLVELLDKTPFEVSKAVNKYNTYRPHKNLQGLTP